MFRNNIIKCSLFLIAGLIVTIKISGQVVSDPQTEYSRIRNLAFSERFEEAEIAAINLVDSFPSYGDARILLARIYAWQNKFDPAITILDSLLVHEPGNQDAIEARNDISGWIDSEEAILENNNDTVNEVVADGKQSPFDLRAGYYFDTFREPYSRFWQVLRIGAGYTKPGIKYVGGINTGNLIAGGIPKIRATEWQIEAEAYPVINSKNYCWISYAFSPGDYFPGHRASAEIWHSFNDGWVASAGMNYYYFDRNIFIAGLSGEKYLGRYWFSSKVYFYFKDSGITTSLYLNARRYFNDTDYFQLSAGFGTAPDEPFDINTALARLSAKSLRIAMNKSVGKKVTVRTGFGYSYEEYFEKEYRNRFDGTISLIYKLNQGK